MFKMDSTVGTISDTTSSDDEEDIGLEQIADSVERNFVSSTSEDETDSRRNSRRYSTQSATSATSTTSDEDIKEPVKTFRPISVSYREIENSSQEDEPVEPPANSRKRTFSPKSNLEGEISMKRSFMMANTLKKSSSPKKEEDSIPGYSNKSQKMMEKMGFKSGQGLGKFGQGRVEIIATSKQKGRRGLGMEILGLETDESVAWDFEKEDIQAKEVVNWLPSCTKDPPVMEELKNWFKEGPKKNTIDDETEFCDPDVLQQVLNCKTVFDKLEPDEMRKARTKSNPFETIRGGIFQNRAAMKMANMDAVFDFMFTNPKNEYGGSLVEKGGLLYFADVCAGPGGFSEYVLWKKKYSAKGFGMTLRGQNDFKLDEFLAGPPETFEPYYGVGGVEGDGDIYNPANLDAFRSFVVESTEGQGVHFVMADGGFSVDGQENIQEILSHQLYLCQFTCALSIIRKGGHFVCKLFDIFTPFSVGLVYLMYRTFEKVCIHKPNTSRPANSERYIICKWRREGTIDIYNYMSDMVKKMYRLNSSVSKSTLCQLVPLDVLKQDELFFDYVCESNNELGVRQVNNLRKIQAFCRNPNLHDDRQSNIRKECFELWQVEDMVRMARSSADPKVKFTELLSKGKGYESSFLSSKPDTLDRQKLSKISSVYNYRCIVSGAGLDKGKAVYLLSTGKSNNYVFDESKNKWTRLEHNVEIPADTLMYVEILQELKGEGSAQFKSNVIHIVDAMVLGGNDIHKLHYTARISEIEKFVKAITKPSRKDLIPIRVKEVFRFEDISSIFERLDLRVGKGSRGFRQLCFFDIRDKECRFIHPKGLMFIKIVQDPWTMEWSKSKRSKYFFNTRKNTSVTEVPLDSIADFRSCFLSRIFWTWESGIRVHDSHPPGSDEKVHRETILDFVASKTVYQRCN